MEKLTVVTIQWGKRYTAEHVYRVQRMAEKHLTIPHRFIAITDQPMECETRPLYPDPKVITRPGQPNNWRKLGILADQTIPHPLLFLDLDILIRQNIDHLITDDPFKILKGRCAPYNSSVFLLNSMNYSYLWTEFDPINTPAKCAVINGKKARGSDQIVMSRYILNAPVWTQHDGIFSYGDIRMRPELYDRAAIIQFAGGIKPWKCPDKKIRFEYLGAQDG